MKKKTTRKDPILNESSPTESSGELFGDREERTEKVELLKEILRDAIEYLGKSGASEGTQYRIDLENEYNLGSYFSELLDVMDAINLNKKNVKSNVSQKNDPQYNDKLPLIGAILIFNKTPPLINILGDRGIDNFQVEAVCKLMDDYAGIMLAYATLFGIRRLRKMAAQGAITDDNLAGGRIKGAQKQREDSEERKRKWRQMGKDFMVAHPGCEVEDAIDHIYPNYAEEYARSSIKGALKGLKKELRGDFHNSK